LPLFAEGMEYYHPDNQKKIEQLRELHKSKQSESDQDNSYKKLLEEGLQQP